MIADVIVGVIILLLTLRGLFRGLIREVLFIASVGGGFIFASLLWKVVDIKIRSFFPSAATSHFASYAIMFLAGFVAVFIAGFFLRKILQITLLMWVDRVGGGIVGFLKGVIICGALLFLITSFWPGVVKDNSKICFYVMGFTKRLSVFVPKKVRREFDKHKDHITKYFSEDFWYKLFNIKKGKREL